MQQSRAEAQGKNQHPDPKELSRQEVAKFMNKDHESQD
jgi:hypothetical protein